jgi:hypothetical protein
MGRGAMARLMRVAAIMGVAMAAACAQDSPSAPAPVPPDPGVTALRVAGMPAELSPGGSVQLKAEVILANGSVKECVAAWSVDDARVAAISPTGLVTAALTGFASVTASCEALSAQAVAKVVAANPYQLVIVAYDEEVPSEFGVSTEMEFLDGPSAGQRVPTGWVWTNGLPGVTWPVRVRFTAEDYEPKEFVLAESTGKRRNSTSPLFDFRIPMKFVADAQTDTHVRQMTKAESQMTHPFTMRQPGSVQIRTWWSVDYNDRLSVELWCNGEMLASRTQHAGSAGSGLTQDAPAGSCETRLRQFKSDASTHYRLAIRYPR